MVDARLQSNQSRMTVLKKQDIQHHRKGIQNEQSVIGLQCVLREPQIVPLTIWLDCLVKGWEQGPLSQPCIPFWKHGRHQAHRGTLGLLMARWFIHTACFSFSFHAYCFRLSPRFSRYGMNLVILWWNLILRIGLVTWMVKIDKQSKFSFSSFTNLNQRI